MKWLMGFLIGVILILSCMPLAFAGDLDLTSSDTSIKNITTDSYESSGFVVKYFSNNETQLTSDTIMWKEKGSEFWVRFTDDLLYDTKVKDSEVLKVPLTEAHFEVNQFETETTCTGNQYYQSCSYQELSFADFEANNIITNKTITPRYPEGWDG